MLDAKLKYMKKHGEQIVKHKPAIEREDLRRLQESAVISPTTSQGLHFNVWFHFIMSTWTGQAKKPDEVQFSIPPETLFFQFPRRFWKGPEELVWFEN